MKLHKSKVVALLIASLMLISPAFINTSFAQQTTMYVYPNYLTATVCTEFTVEIRIEDVYNLNAWQAFLSFNPALMQCISATEGPFLKQGGPTIFPPPMIDNNQGYVGTACMLMMQTGVSGSGTLVFITFHCTGGGTSPLHLYDTMLWDPFMNSIPHTTIDGTVTQFNFYFKPAYPDYAQSGVPDFDQRQDQWTNPGTGKWSWCGPTAVANSLWWLDSEYETNQIPPLTVMDTFPLVKSYSTWDDHDPRNVPPFITELAMDMDTDGMRTGSNHAGTKIDDMANGIAKYLLDHEVYDQFYVKKTKMPTFEYITEEVQKCEDTILLIGIWQEQPMGSGHWVRVGGHYVTVSGIDSSDLQIAFCDPYTDNAENGGAGVVKPPPPHGHPPAPPETLHNNATYVSYDFHPVTLGSPSPGGPQLGIAYGTYNTLDLINNMQGQNCPSEFENMQGQFSIQFPWYFEVEYGIFISPWYAKPPAKDYAPVGVPDFDQRQDGWINPWPPQGTWSHCGPVAEANSLWYLDSYYEPKPVTPPAISDNFPLVTAYGQWDDHDPRNVQPFISDLAWYMDTNGMRTGIVHCGTYVTDMQQGIDMYLTSKGVTWKLYEHTVPSPPIDLINDELRKCQDVVLLLGFWQYNPNTQQWWRIGGHYVTVVGIDSQDPHDMYMAISDPINDKAEAGGMGSVPIAHTHAAPQPPYVTHNNASLVSHDLYHVIPDPCPGGPFSLEGYWNETVDINFVGQNYPEQELGYYIPGLPVHTQLDYAVIVSCKTGIVAAGSEDTNVYAWDFYGNLQWSFATAAPVLSVAMDNDGKYLASGSRILPDGPGFLSFFDAKAVTNGGINFPLWMLPLNISDSYDGGWMGSESKSVDVKYNSYNQFDVVAAATDQGVYLYDQFGNLIWHYYDGNPETIVRISQDGNSIICASYHQGLAGGVCYFSQMTDGKPGWGPGDVKPVWSLFASDGFTFWVAISGLGDYVALSGYRPSVGYYVSLHYGKNGSEIWTYKLPKGAFVRVDMPCDGRSVVSVNDDPTDSVGTDLNYFSDMLDGTAGWSHADGTPMWTYWPGKEGGGQQTITDDFYSVAISENGDFVAAGGVPANTYLLTNGGAIQQIVGLMPAAVQSVDLTFTGKYGASVDRAGNIWFYSKDTGFMWSWSEPQQAPFHCVTISKLYPCMFPYPNHDVAVTKITTSKDGCKPKSTVCKGFPVKINVTVLNQGDFAESFTVSVYINSTLILSQNIVSLAAHTETKLTLVWTSTPPMGNFNITACASIVHDETSVYDNTRIERWFAVVKPGDINGDGKCDGKDVAFAAKAYNTRPGDTNWNPNADINGDGKVDGKDIAIVAKYYNT